MAAVSGPSIKLPRAEASRLIEMQPRLDLKEEAGAIVELYDCIQNMIRLYKDRRSQLMERVLGTELPDI